MWLDKLKIAIIEKDTDAMAKLIADVPPFKNAKEVEEAKYLSMEVVKILEKLKAQTKTDMVKIKKNIDFLRSTKAPESTKFDIKF